MFICKVCNKNIKTERGLKIHISSMHSSKRFDCNICNKKFSTKQRLQYHTEHNVCSSTIVVDDGKTNELHKQIKEQDKKIIELEKEIVKKDAIISELQKQIEFS